MTKLKQILLSKGVVLSLIFLILVAVFIGYIVPQKIITSEIDLNKWRDANPELAFWTDKFGLHHVYTTPWFALIMMAFFISLIISTVEQIKYSRKATFGEVVQSDGTILETDVTYKQLANVLRKNGYIQLFRNNERSRFIKQPWGHWGNVLLHLGLMVLIASSLILTLTENRGLIHLVEGEKFLPGNPWFRKEQGLLANRFILPISVGLDKVEVDYWETDDIKHIATIVSFIDKHGNSRKYSLGINNTLHVDGVKAYQGKRYGNSFFVEITDPEGKKYRTRFQIDHPHKREQAGYGDFVVEGIPYLIKTKYYADADKKSINSDNPLLVIRLVTEEMHLKDISERKLGSKSKLIMDIEQKESIEGEVSLRLGESGTLGPYTATLVHVSKWSEIIFVESHGVIGIFSAFVIIVMGVSFTYFIPPREFYARKTETGYSLRWKASRFEIFYENEFEEISKALRGMHTQ